MLESLLVHLECESCRGARRPPLGHGEDDGVLVEGPDEPQSNHSADDIPQIRKGDVEKRLHAIGSVYQSGFFLVLRHCLKSGEKHHHKKWR